MAFQEVDDLRQNLIEGHRWTLPLSGLFLSVSAKMTHFRHEGKGGL